MGLYDGSNEIIRKLIHNTWVPAQSIREWEIAIAGLMAARGLIDDESDKAQLTELIELGFQSIRELITGVDEDDDADLMPEAEAVIHYQQAKQKAG